MFFLRSLIPRPISTFSASYHLTHSATTLIIGPDVPRPVVGEATHRDAPVVPSLSLIVTPLWTPPRPSRPDDTTLCSASRGDLPDPIVMAESLSRASELSPPNPDQHKPPPITLSSP